MKKITAIFLSLKRANAISFMSFPRKRESNESAGIPASAGKTCIGVAAILLVWTNAFAFTTTGFSNPYGIATDQKTGMIYVSNVNGDLESKDDNGFISRLKNDGTVDQIRFIDGAASDVVLHAPKGMVVLGNYLYVCDIDALHSYDLNTGKQLFDVNFGELPHQSFYSIIIGPDGALYVTDAGVNAIYRIDVTKQHEVTLLVGGDVLGNPHGITWYPARQIFLVAGGVSGQITVYDKSGMKQNSPAILLKSLEGIDIDDGGSIYVASRELGAVYRITPSFAVNSFKAGLSTPAGVTYNRSDKSVIVATFNDNTVQSFTLNR